MEEVVFMLQVKRSERGLESRLPSSLVSPDALLQQETKKDKRQDEQEEKWKDNDEGARGLLQALCVIFIYINYSPWCFCPGTGLSFTRHPETNQTTTVTATGWCPPGSPHPLPTPPPSSLDTERDVRHHARRESTVLGIRVQHTMRWLLEARSSFTITKCIIPSTVLYATFP